VRSLNKKHVIVKPIYSLSTPVDYNNYGCNVREPKNKYYDFANLLTLSDRGSVSLRVSVAHVGTVILYTRVIIFPPRVIFYRFFRCRENHNVFNVRFVETDDGKINNRFSTPVHAYIRYICIFFFLSRTLNYRVLRRNTSWVHNVTLIKNKRDQLGIVCLDVILIQ